MPDDLDPSASDVLQRWFAAHRDGDLAAARELMAPGAAVRVPGRQVEGFDGLMEWYAERTAAFGPSFRYDLVDLLEGQNHVAAVLELSDGSRSWQQVAVYEVHGGRITAVTAYEDA